MEWAEKVKEYTESVSSSFEELQLLLGRIIPLLDLTSLHADDTEESIAFFCEQAKTPYGDVAAICTYPKFVKITATEFANSKIKIATVANFPAGNKPLEAVLIEINNALEDGAEEIDMVFPYTRYLSGERDAACKFVSACKAACGEDALLKIILETGALLDLKTIAEASADVLKAGADFIKTSTGKIAKGASLEAAATMLLVIRDLTPQLNRRLGFKASGGIRKLEEAAQYISLADRIMSREWVTPETFRIGTSDIKMIKPI